MSAHTKKRVKLNKKRKYTRKRKRIQSRGKKLLIQISNSASESIHTM